MKLERLPATGPNRPELDPRPQCAMGAIGASPFRQISPGGPGYPADQVESFSEVHLGTALSLSDGDSVVISMRDL